MALVGTRYFDSVGSEAASPRVAGVPQTVGVLVASFRGTAHDGPMSTSRTHPLSAPIVGGGYALRAIAVPGSLDDLQGPLEGQVRLPHHLDWSARAVYDLSDERWRRLLYEIVLEEAATVEDLRTWINGEALLESWPHLYLPRVVRAAWEARHPALRERGAGAGEPRP